MRSLTNAKHYKEALRKEFAKEKTEVVDTLPIVYLLKDNTYMVTPLEFCHYGYETRMIMAKWKLNGKTQTKQGVRNKQRRAVYRNFNWENLYDRCPLYWDFAEGKNQFLKIMYSEKNAKYDDKFFLFLSNGGDPQFAKKVQESAKDFVYNLLGNTDGIDISIDYIVVYTTAAFSGVLLHWYEDDSKDDINNRCNHTKTYYVWFKRSVVAVFLYNFQL